MCSKTQSSKIQKLSSSRGSGPFFTLEPFNQRIGNLEPSGIPDSKFQFSLHLDQSLIPFQLHNMPFSSGKEVAKAPKATQRQTERQRERLSIVS